MQTATQKIAQVYMRRHPEEAAWVLERFSPDELVMALREASVESVAGVLACFAPVLAGSCLAHWPEGQRSRVVEQLPVSIAAALLRQMEPAVREDVLGGLSATARASLNQALRYPDQSAGALADPSVLALHSDLTVEEALARLSESDGPVASRIFVLDRSQRLVGAVTPGQLLNSRRDTPVESLELDTAPGMPAHASAQTLGARQASLEPIAVVDSQGTFLGAIGADTLKNLGTRKSRPPAMHLLASLSEFYSLGLSEMFGGSSSGSPVTNQPGETRHANS